ncbi:MAG: CaiB/BaiF CoA transferase family protein [Hyphomicrobiaceae bacterium]
MTVVDLPLKGVRVLDLSRVLAGPYCSLMMADLGADVVKIENPKGGDDSRGFSVPNVDGHAVYFMAVNRNKRSVAIDLKSKAGRDVFLKLVAQSDIVLENFRTGVMERLGLGYDTLKQIKPELIYCAISGYGRDGPNVDVPGYDPVAQAESGLMSMSGDPDGEAVRTGPSLVDMVCGMFTAHSAIAALRHAERTGEGRFVEATLHESGLNMLINFAASHLITGAVPTRAGNTNQLAQPAGVYQASDGPLMIAVGNNGQFTRLCRDVLQRQDLLDDPRFVDNAARVRNRPDLEDILAKIFAGAPRQDWVVKLRNADVPAGAVASVDQALGSELVSARGIIRDVEHAGVGSYRALMGPVRLHDSEATPLNGAPLLGQHTRDVLRDLAGLSDAAIDELAAGDVVKLTD